MYKKSLGTTVLVFLAMSQQVLAQYYFKLVCKGFQVYDRSKIELHFQDCMPDGSMKKMMIMGENAGDDLVFTGFIQNAAVSGYILEPSSKRQFLLVIDSGYTRLGLNSTLKLNKLNPIDNNTNQLMAKHHQLLNSNIHYGKPVANQTIRDVRLKELKLIEENPDNFYSIIMLNNLSSIISLKPEEIENVFLRLGVSIKKSNIGQRVFNNIRNAKTNRIGHALPDFEFTTINGRPFSNTNLQGHKSVLIFSATWCGPCKKQIPLLKTLSNEFPEMFFVYINLDDDTNKWKEMIDEYGIHGFINVVDNKPMTSSEMAQRLNINALPTVVLTDADQIIRYNSAELFDIELLNIREYLTMMAGEKL